MIDICGTVHRILMLLHVSVLDSGADSTVVLGLFRN